jgi:hypothetical protein
MPSDDSMIGPGAHEQVAHSQAMEKDNASAMVYAILALASAVNRLVDAQRDLVNIEMDRTYPTPRKRLHKVADAQARRITSALCSHNQGCDNRDEHNRYPGTAGCSLHAPRRPAPVAPSRYL